MTSIVLYIPQNSLIKYHSWTTADQPCKGHLANTKLLPSENSPNITPTYPDTRTYTMAYAQKSDSGLVIYDQPVKTQYYPLFLSFNPKGIQIAAAW